MKTLNKSNNISWNFRRNDKVYFNSTIEGNKLIIDIDFNLYRHSLFWKKINLELNNKLKTLYTRGESISKTFYSKEFTVDSHKKRIIINLDDIEGYSYDWVLLNSSFNAKLIIDDSIFFDTKLNFNVKKEPVTNFKKWLTSYFTKKARKNDRYNLVSNFFALSTKLRFSIVFWTIFVLALSVISFTFIYIFIIIVGTLYFKKTQIYIYILLKV